MSNTEDRGKPKWPRGGQIPQVVIRCGCTNHEGGTCGRVLLVGYRQPLEWYVAEKDSMRVRMRELIEGAADTPNELLAQQAMAREVDRIETWWRGPLDIGAAFTVPLDRAARALLVGTCRYHRGVSIPIGEAYDFLVQSTGRKTITTIDIPRLYGSS